MTSHRTVGSSWLVILACLLMLVGVSTPGRARDQPALPPHQAATSPDSRWDPRIDTLGVRWDGSDVQELVVNTAGEVFAAGEFEWAGTSAAQSIARWNGRDWQPVGLGQLTYESLPPSITAMAVSGTNLYVGGTFTTIDGVTVNHIAKWDGTTWSALGDGVSGEYPPSIATIAVHGTDVYVGGFFTRAGDVPANHIAKWDGTTWSALGSGVSNSGPGNWAKVRTLAISGSDVYVGGNFLYAGGKVVHHIAKWDGSAWSDLDGGVAGSTADVTALAISGSNVYVGGNFTSAGAKSTNHVAHWNGSDWFPLAGSLPTDVEQLAVVASHVYVTTRGARHEIRTWTGSDWGVAHTVKGSAYTLASYQNTLYVGGDFTAIDTTAANGIAQREGTQWRALGRGVGRRGHAWHMSVGHDGVYISGHFNAAGDIQGSTAARWDGTTWSPFGRSVHRITAGQHGIYGAKEVTVRYPNPELTIVTWNGMGWDPLTSPVTEFTQPSINAIVEHGTDLYVGGSFTQAGGTPRSSIARWDGSQWLAVGGGIQGTVHAMEIIGNDLYVGGDFHHAGGIAAKGIARWDGSQWLAVGGGIQGTVHAMETIGNDLYVGGSFLTAGDERASHVAKWDGQQWSALGIGIFPPEIDYDTWQQVYAIAVDRTTGYVYVGGQFTEVAHGSIEGPTVVPANNVAVWDGTRWLPLGSGVNDRVYALGVYQGDLYVTGGFTETGGIPAYGFARWAKHHELFLPMAGTGF